MNHDNKEVLEGVQRLINENQALKEELDTLNTWKEGAIRWLHKGDIEAALHILDHGCPF